MFVDVGLVGDNAQVTFPGELPACFLYEILSLPAIILVEIRHHMRYVERAIVGA